MDHEETSNNFFVILVVLVLVFIGIKLWNPGDEVDVYSLTCWVPANNGGCTTTRWSGNKRTYIVNTGSQKVIDKNAEKEGIPINLTECSIVDKNNWHCMYSDNSATLGMASGKFWEEGGSNPPKIFGGEMKKYPPTYVSKWQYLSTISKGCDNWAPLCWIMQAIFD